MKNITSEEYYLKGFIEQFGDGPSGELSPEKWTALDFLLWLELNGFEIIKANGNNMMTSKEKYDNVIDEAYEKYRVKVKDTFCPVYRTKDEFIETIKNYEEFSKKWGLKIEENQLSLEEMLLLELKLGRTPTKKITVIYNNQKIDYYE